MASIVVSERQHGFILETESDDTKHSFVRILCCDTETRMRIEQQISLTITVVGRFVNAGEWSFSDRIRIRILTSVDKEGEPISVAWILTLRAVLFACSSGFARKRIPLEFTSSIP